ncbi:MAG: hypothetical protein ACRD0D_04040 [Acidimicrobiales bacterium]
MLVIGLVSTFASSGLVAAYGYDGQLDSASPATSALPDTFVELGERPERSARDAGGNAYDDGTPQLRSASARAGGDRLAPNTAGRAAGLADDGVNVIPSSGRTFVGTPRGTVYDVPEGWAPRVADNGRGIVYQRPGATGNADMIRIMDPTSKYPNGYVRYYNQYGQPLDVYGRPGPPSATHISQDYQGPWPGWPG